MVKEGAFSHKIDYVTISKEILNLKGHPNRITGSKVMAILLNGWILPIGGVSSGRVCACQIVFEGKYFILCVFDLIYYQRYVFGLPMNEALLKLC